ncbi:type IV pilus biogenesis protein PilM [Serratia fonticola]|uniref:type IV pilus biogenesis protein PilM n=1 Tax=Serratia fonticola TaxID=47917 RepID=UPI001377038C|nr:type IV pilus biogenesis protein PilM [Serratia fonticola]NCG54479.1 type IV pilus biogenesis protein PilM [Serratia fonticola]
MPGARGRQTPGDTLMGAWLLSCALVLSLVVASIDGRLGERALQKASVGDSAQRAAQMVTLVNAINDHLYHTPQTQGPVSLAVLGLTFTPDPRIEHVLQDGRLWVFTPEVPGLVTALRQQTRHSALICTVTNGRLLTLAGEDMNQTLPAGVAEGDVVILN